MVLVVVVVRSSLRVVVVLECCGWWRWGVETMDDLRRCSRRQCHRGWEPGGYPVSSAAPAGPRSSCTRRRRRGGARWIWGVRGSCRRRIGAGFRGRTGGPILGVRGGLRLPCCGGMRAGCHCGVDGRTGRRLMRGLRKAGMWLRRCRREEARRGCWRR